MLLSQPWLKDAKATQDWGVNMITIQNNGTICIVVVTCTLDSSTKRSKALLCYDFQNGIMDGED